MEIERIADNAGVVFIGHADIIRHVYLGGTICEIIDLLISILLPSQTDPSTHQETAVSKY